MNWAGEPPASRALYDAYLAATTMPVAWSYQRSMDLAELVRRAITAADVLAVLTFVKRKVARGDGGFGETSLLWRNAMTPDAMEERALLVRQQAQRRARSSAPVARTDAAGVTRLDAAPAAMEVPLAKDSLGKLMREIGGPRA